MTYGKMMVAQAKVVTRTEKGLDVGYTLQEKRRKLEDKFGNRFEREKPIYNI